MAEKCKRTLEWALEEAGYSEKEEIPGISEAAQMLFVDF